ncbi:MAG TPA: prepilin-type N-terminal cleavage/methylation domain-containing protein [Candidatus Saccharimonadales bacterium]
MRRGISGFTIVELLIVIVVIGILASITVVAYNGVQQRARNVARLTNVNSWIDLFEIYRAANGRYPSVPEGDYCLGTDFPPGLDGQPRCRNLDTNSPTVSYLQSGNTALMNALKTVGSLPRNEHGGVNWIAGPYVHTWDGGYYLTQVFQGGAGNCPAGFNQDWVSGTGVVLCGIEK